MMKSILLSVCVLASVPASAQWIVEDTLANAKLFQELLQGEEQLKQTFLQLTRAGDPGAILRLVGAQGLLDGIAEQTVSLSLEQLRPTFSGLDALRYDGQGLYRIVSEQIVTSGGEVTLRPAAEYVKLDAVTKAAGNFRAVYADTATRLQETLAEVRATSERLRTAETDAEVQKLQGVLSAQSTVAQAIEHERVAARDQVLVQEAENRNDERRQAQARLEDATADFHSVQSQLNRVLVPAPGSALIPDPRTVRRLPTTRRPASMPASR